MEEMATYHLAAATVKSNGHVPPMPCPACGTVEIPLLYEGTGPHVAKAVSACCQRFIRWIPKALVQGKEQAMGGVNRIILVGTISKYGVTVKYAPSGTPCANFVLVLSEQDREGKIHQVYIDCEVWGRKAEGVSDLEPGALCLFEGKVAKRKKGESQWELIIAGFDVTPIQAPAVSTGGRTN